MLSVLRERSLCLLNSDRTPVNCQPWLTMTDAQFHPDVWYVIIMSIQGFSSFSAVLSIHH